VRRGKSSFPTSYDGFCPFLLNRYRCVDKLTSADDWEFHYKFKGCAIPGYWDSSHRLAGRTIMLCGDSHLQQIFLEIACAFQGEVLDSSGYKPPFPPRGKGYNISQYLWQKLLVEFASRWERKSGHKWSKDKYSAGEFLSKEVALYEYPVRLGVVAGVQQTVTFKNGVKMIFSHLRSFTGSGPQRIEACLKMGARALGSLDLNVFDHVVLNSFVDIQASISVLQKYDYRKSVFAIPRWEGKSHTFSVRGPAPRTLETTGPCLQEWDKVNGTLPFSLFRLPLCALARSRYEDATANIYPFTYRSDANKTVACMEGHGGHFSKCKGHDWHICNEQPCSWDDHFCMPGPTRAFATLVLAAVSNSV